MPTIWESGTYRFFFYSGDRDEPPHVHVEHERNKTKFWLDPVRECFLSRFDLLDPGATNLYVHGFDGLCGKERIF